MIYTGSLILILFYGAYFGKVWAQKRQGIRTNQMGIGQKVSRTVWVERLLKLVTAVIIPVELASMFLIPRAFEIRLIGWMGLVLGMVGVAIFICAMVTMKASWRAGIPSEDKTEMVKHGIYRYSRNPAFVGFDLVYIGMFLAFPNVLHFVVMSAAVVMMHLQILEEEKFLEVAFAKAYETYKQEVRRYV